MTHEELQEMIEHEQGQQRTDSRVVDIAEISVVSSSA